MIFSPKTGFHPWIKSKGMLFGVMLKSVGGRAITAA
jgi:hypothetical protein